MPVFFSAAQHGFYHSELSAHLPKPADAVEITEELHHELMRGQATGNFILADAEGKPYLGLPEQTPAERAAALARQAKAALTDSDIVVLRHYEAGEPVPPEWVLYRCELRQAVRGERDTMPKAPANRQ